MALLKVEVGAQLTLGRGEYDQTSFCVASAIVFELGKDRFPALTVNLRKHRAVIETKFQ